MKFLWDEEKNKILKTKRNISFEQIVHAMENNQIADVIEHPNQEKYKGQYFILIEFSNYIYVVPANISDSGENCKLLTIYPSRKYTKKYLGERK